MPPDVTSAASAANPLQLVAFDHLVLTVRDPDATFDFYCRIIGMEKRSLPNGRYALHFGFSKINIHPLPATVVPRADAALPGTGDFCIVSSLEPRVLAATLAARGATIELGPTERTGARGAMTSFYLRDPDGNLVEIATYRRDAGDAPTLDRVRRVDRAETDPAWIDAFLGRAPTAVMGFPGGDWPALNANLFVYERETRTLYFHTAGQGSTRNVVQASGLVTVCVFAMGRLLPAPVVTDYSVEYASVMLRGIVSIVEDRAVVRRTFEMQMAKYFPDHRPGVDYRPFTDEEAARATVYRVDILQWSAKQHRAAAAHPGAFHYGADLFFEGMADE